jgi:glutamate dehydrogenase/leucine dehydrogenase
VAALEHEEVLVTTGRRSGLPVVVAVHSTRLGQAVGGCRVWHYADWRDGLEDALRLSAAMTRKVAVSQLDNGGGKTVVAIPDGAAINKQRRADALRDAGEAVASLGGRYAIGPDVGTDAADMAIIGECTEHVFCKPPELGGSGDPSPHTAAGVVAALRAACSRVYGSADLRGRRFAISGLGKVGGHVARELTTAGASLMVSDIDTGKRELARELGSFWVDPDDILTAEADVLIPAGLGGVLTSDIVPRLRCAAILGPANNQLAEPSVADLLHKRGIMWVPDYVASAGGVIYALTMELQHETQASALARVRAIEETVAQILDLARQTGRAPADAAQDLVRHRLESATIPDPRLSRIRDRSI